MWENVERLVSTLGFPVFVAVWMLVRSDRLHKELSETIRKLTVVIERCKWRE